MTNELLHSSHETAHQAKLHITWIDRTKKEPIQRALPQLAQLRLPEGWSEVICSSRNWVAYSANDGFFFKAYPPRYWYDRLKSRLFGGRARRAWRKSKLLQRNGFPTLNFVCWGRQNSTLFSVTLKIPGSSLDEYIANNWNSPLTGKALELKRQLLAQLGQLIGQLHQSGIYHADLLPQNIIVSNARFHLIDNDHNRRYLRIPENRIVSNFLQINQIPVKYASCTDRLRVLRAYHDNQTLYDWNTLRTLAKRIHSETLHKIQANAL